MRNLLFLLALCLFAAPATAGRNFVQENPAVERIFEAHKDRLKFARKMAVETRSAYIRAAMNGSAEAERRAAVVAYRNCMDIEVEFRKSLKAAGLPVAQD